MLQHFAAHAWHWIALLLSAAIFGAVQVKDAASSASKFVARAQAAAGDYQKGVQGAGDKWAQHTAAAGDSYQAGVQQAISRQAFQKGVAKAGPSGYVTRAANAGAQRYGPGVAGAQAKWQQNVQPYLDTIAGLTLPPRSPRGSPNNLQRVAAVANALRARKVGS